MVKQRLFIMNDGTYIESPMLDAGPLIHRSDDGGTKRLRHVSILMIFNTHVAFFFLLVFLVGLIEEPRWGILWFLLISGALFSWIYLDWNHYRIVRPVTEIYEQGLLIHKVGWPRQDALFWPYDEIGSFQLEGKTVRLRSKNGRGKASFPLYEVGEVGFSIIEERLQELSSLDEHAPRLILYEPS